MRTLLALSLLLPSLAYAGDPPIVPDPTLTPGAVATTDLSKICEDGYSKIVRHTSEALKAEIYREYGIDKNAGHFEIDHRVPLVGGGADVKENLWPQSYETQPWNAHLKDHLEVLIRTMVCKSELTVEEGQAAFLGDWREAFKKYIGEPEDGN